jgi:acetyl-CoA synthetase
MTPSQPNPLWQSLDTDDFTWTIPDRLNIAEACTDYQATDDLALIVDTGDTAARFTFGELGILSRRFAQFLADQGVEAGDRVAVMVPQGVEVVTAHLGSFRRGAVTVPLSVKFGPEAVSYRLRHSGAKLLVIDAENFDRVRGALLEMPDLVTVVVVHADADADENLTRPVLRAISVVAFGDALGSVVSSAAAATGPDTPAIIIYTSGTTGHPKGALHGHRILPAHMPGVRIAFNNAPAPDDVFWTPADWAWIGGLFDVLFTALALGRTVVAAPDKFTPARALELMRRHRVTAAFVPPTALKQMRSSALTAGDTDGLAVRILATGGEVLGTALRTWVEQTFGVAINEFYGQTEMNMTIGTVIGDWRPEPDSMGRPFPGFDIAVLDAAGHRLSAGETGEICVRAGNPGQFLGYWDQPDKTAEKVRGGWIYTGDLGRMDEDGNLWYQGRADDVISSAGYRVGPSEIEECLMSHPAVAMAAVVGELDELRGEAIHAFVVLTDGHHGSDQLAGELQQHVKSRLAFYQYPRRITFRTELPLTTTGKILRRELRRSLLPPTADSPR